MSVNSKAVYGIFLPDGLLEKMLAGIDSISSLLKNPQQRKENEQDKTYCSILPFNFHSLIT